MRKRSIAIKGHRTSILLEPEFWRVLEEAAEQRGLTLPLLVAEIDGARLPREPRPGLASALRVYALGWVQASGVRNEAD